MVARKRLREIKSLLQKAYGDRLRAVVLYGSEARGEAQDDSDIDILVVLEGPVDFGRELRQSIHATYPLVLEWGRPIAPSPVAVEEYESSDWPLYRTARREGIVA